MYRRSHVTLKDILHTNKNASILKQRALLTQISLVFTSVLSVSPSYSTLLLSFWQLVLDQDSFFPTTMPSSTQAGTKRGPVDANRGNAPTTSMGARERGAGGAGHIRPSRGAEDIYIQARTLFRAMVQMPQYAEEVNLSTR